MDENRRKGDSVGFPVKDVTNSKSIYGYGFLFKNEDSIKGIRVKIERRKRHSKKNFWGVGYLTHPLYLAIFEPPRTRPRRRSSVG